MVEDEAARRGVLRFMNKKGGAVPIGLLHGHSKVAYQRAHQEFSAMMEGLVADDLVTFSDDTFHLTELGKQSIDGE